MTTIIGGYIIPVDLIPHIQYFHNSYNPFVPFWPYILERHPSWYEAHPSAIAFDPVSAPPSSTHGSALNPMAAEFVPQSAMQVQVPDGSHPPQIPANNGTITTTTTTTASRLDILQTSADALLVLMEWQEEKVLTAAARKASSVGPMRLLSSMHFSDAEKDYNQARLAWRSLIVAHQKVVATSAHLDELPSQVTEHSNSNNENDVDENNANNQNNTTNDHDKENTIINTNSSNNKNEKKKKTKKAKRTHGNKKNKRSCKKH